VTQDILTLGMQADEVRRRLFGSRVTYQRVQVIASAMQPLPEIAAAATEVRLLGLPPTLDDAVAAVRALRSIAGGRRVSAFSLAALITRTTEGWGGLDETLAQLRDAGADDVAEIALDEVDDLAGAMRQVRGAGLLGERLTLTRPAGPRLEELLARAATAGSVRRVSPLPRVVAHDRPTTGYEDVRTIALARLALAGGADGSAPSIEVDWSLYGPKLAQVALLFGADHLDAVSPFSDPSLGRRRETVEDVERNIRAAGFEPHEYRPAA
jgi:hypothetical protein